MCLTLFSTLTSTGFEYNVCSRLFSCSLTNYQFERKKDMYKSGWKTPLDVWTRKWYNYSGETEELLLQLCRSSACPMILIHPVNLVPGSGRRPSFSCKFMVIEPIRRDHQIRPDSFHVCDGWQSPSNFFLQNSHFRWGHHQCAGTHLDLVTKQIYFYQFSSDLGFSIASETTFRHILKFVNKITMSIL